MKKYYRGMLLATGFALVGFVVGIAYAIHSPWPQMILADRGHALYEVGSEEDLGAITKTVQWATGEKPFMEINSGPTHQVVLSDGITVFATVHEVFTEGTANVRMFVTKAPVTPMQAAETLRATLAFLGHKDVWLYEPDPKLPKGTMVIVRSKTAFPGDGGIGFRPNGNTMQRLEPDAAKLL